MKTTTKLLTLAGLVGLLTMPAWGQGTAQTTAPQQQDAGGTSLYSITVSARTTKAINYGHLSSATKIGFRGTVLQPLAKGEAKVEGKGRALRISAKFEKLEPAQRFGPQFMTYVLWAISPEGRADNMGEILLSGGKGKLETTAQLQAFAMIVTAEPYFAVIEPSEVVVMENEVRPDTVGNVEEVEAKFALLKRGKYNFVDANSQTARLDPAVPLSVHEARNAVKIAEAAGAERYAPDSYRKAVQYLQTAEQNLAGKADSKQLDMTAREAVQTAEDARAITAKRMEEERAERERRAAQEREAQARAEQEAALRAKLEAQLAAERAARERAEAEAVRAAALAQQQQAQQQAEQARLEAEQAARAQAESDAARAAAEEQQKKAQAEADAARLAAEHSAQMQAQSDAARAQAQAQAEQAAKDRAAAEAARQSALAGQQAAEAEAAKARAAAEQAEKEKADLRAKLLSQLNTILQTRDSARGLIINMSDVLFDTGSYTLKPGAREKLAKISGIVMAHPSLNLQIEGHTDSVGTDEYNQMLSERRAGAVKDYLVQQGVASSAVTSKGFGKSQPVADNSTAEGRQRNRRVELVVNGEAIGTTAASAGATGEASATPR